MGALELRIGRLQENETTARCTAGRGLQHPDWQWVVHNRRHGDWQFKNLKKGFGRSAFHINTA
jgi:hypothetical protein